MMATMAGDIRGGHDDWDIHDGHLVVTVIYMVFIILGRHTYRTGTCYHDGLGFCADLNVCDI
jgi:hypothetical protein